MSRSRRKMPTIGITLAESDKPRSQRIALSEKKKSKVLEAVHEAAKGLYAARAIDQATMRQFNGLCVRAGPAKRDQNGTRSLSRSRPSRVPRDG